MQGFNIDQLLDNTFVRILLIAVCFFVIHIIIRLSIGVVIRGLVRDTKFSSTQAAKQRERTLSSVLGHTSAVILWILGIGTSISQLNFDWAGLLAGASVLGLVIGLGAQKVAGDFLAGFFILLENQFGIGDVVEVKDMAYGEVEHINMRTTHIRNLDGGLHIIANSEIVNMANHSYGWATALIYLWIHHEADLDMVEKIINQTGLELAKDEVWAKEVKSPIVFDRIEDYGADGTKIRALGTTGPSMQWAVAGEFRRRLKPKLDKAGVKIAYPNRIVEQV